jgi:hypothetical protein
VSIAPFRYGQAIVVVRPGGRDMHGDPTAETEHEIEGVCIYDAAVDEAINGTTVDADFVMLGAYGIDIEETDTVYLKSDDERTDPYFVQGRPWQIKHPITGWEAGSRTLLNQRRGGTP